jgi:Collagen triple helix repeat (20 copies)
MRRRDLIAAAAGAVVATVLASGIAWGAIGDGGVIQGCYDAGGNLKVVAALPCPKGYTQLPWNQQGVQGPPGKDGANGTNGVNGQHGVSVASESEPAGANCAEGGSKFTAANGVTYACNGAPGTQGIQGIPGETGAAGAQGPKGDKGDTGDIGPAGPAGPAGGLSGSQKVEQTQTAPGNQSGQFFRLTCTTGKAAVSAGFDSNLNVYLRSLDLNGTTADVFVTRFNFTTTLDQPWSATAWVLCADS